MDSQETTFIPDGDIQMFTSIIDALGIYWKRGLSEFVAVLEDRYFLAVIFISVTSNEINTIDLFLGVCKL